MDRTRANCDGIFVKESLRDLEQSTLLQDENAGLKKSLAEARQRLTLKEKEAATGASAQAASAKAALEGQIQALRKAKASGEELWKKRVAGLLEEKSKLEEEGKQAAVQAAQVSKEKAAAQEALAKAEAEAEGMKKKNQDMISKVREKPPPLLVPLASARNPLTPLGFRIDVPD